MTEKSIQGDESTRRIVGRSERRVEHWTLKKEVNIANILVTVSSVAMGMWWLFNLSATMTLGDRDLAARIDMAEREMKYIESKVLSNTNDSESAKDYMRSIDSKLSELLVKFSYLEGVRASEGENNGK